MSTSPAGRGDISAPPAIRTVEPAHRGQLRLSRDVVEKVASQAALEVVATSGRPRRLLGFGAKANPGARPSVEADLSTESTDLAIAVGIPYPGSIRAATQQIRSHVTNRVEELTGVDVRRVDIDVTFLHAEASDTRTLEAPR